MLFLILVRHVLKKVISFELHTTHKSMKQCNLSSEHFCFIHHSLALTDVGAMNLVHKTGIKSVPSGDYALFGMDLTHRDIQFPVTSMLLSRPKMRN